MSTAAAPSEVVTPGESARPWAIGVDIGGTKIAAGVVDERGGIIARTRRDTPAQDAGQVLDAIADAVRELTGTHSVEAIGLGAAGFVDETRTVVRFAPNLAWRGEHLAAGLRERVNLPVVVENDANAAAWAEARFGAARGHAHAVILTLGTGIGGGILSDGALLRGRYGMAAEVGHLNIVPDGRRCGCGLQGCWEQYGSGRALAEDAREQAGVSPALAGQLLALAGGSPAGISGEMVTQAAEAGDPVALQCFDELGRWLGRGIAQLAALLDPAVFVLGGGVSAAGEILRGRVEATFHRQLTAHGYRPTAPIRVAELGAEAGLVGAADLARFR